MCLRPRSESWSHTKYALYYVYVTGCQWQQRWYTYQFQGSRESVEFSQRLKIAICSRTLLSSRYYEYWPHALQVMTFGSLQFSCTDELVIVQRQNNGTNSFQKAIQIFDSDYSVLVELLLAFAPEVTRLYSYGRSTNRAPKYASARALFTLSWKKEGGNWTSRKCSSSFICLKKYDRIYRWI